MTLFWPWSILSAALLTSFTERQMLVCACFAVCIFSFVYAFVCFDFTSVTQFQILCGIWVRNWQWNTLDLTCRIFWQYVLVLPCQWSKHGSEIRRWKGETEDVKAVQTVEFCQALHWPFLKDSRHVITGTGQKSLFFCPIFFKCIILIGGALQCSVLL